MLFRISWPCRSVVCADLTINAKQSVKHRRPPVVLDRFLRSGNSERVEIAPAETLDRPGQRFRRVFGGPSFLIVQDNSIQARSADANHWSATGLTFQGDQSKRLLCSGMDKQIGRPVIAG